MDITISTGAGFPPSTVWILVILKQTHEQSRFTWYQFEQFEEICRPRDASKECTDWMLPNTIFPPSPVTPKHEDVFTPEKGKMDLQNWWFVKVSPFPISFFGTCTMLKSPVTTWMPGWDDETRGFSHGYSFHCHSRYSCVWNWASWDINWSHWVCVSSTGVWYHTVDGRNPAPLDMENIP